MSARRPLLTALGATTLLGALWFVPSANATAPERSGLPAVAPANAVAPADVLHLKGSASGSGQTHLALAKTGGVGTTPYVFGGIACFGVGAGFVVFSARRTRAV
ncbi:hypothetical protein [Streptomyces sp. NPDC002054]|uniref:hypothetical protein n=1 Tax=Streptomyces sp. NPDC002054 TaxID=3154663 RepID=UPI003316AA2E